MSKAFWRRLPVSRRCIAFGIHERTGPSKIFVFSVGKRVKLESNVDIENFKQELR